MEQLLGLLKVRVVRGRNLAYRDARGSDPYVVLRMSGQKLKTSVKKKNVNPEWNEDLTLSVARPIEPLRIQVFDKDTFSRDDEMGEAELDIQPFVEAARMELKEFASGTILRTVETSSGNCLTGDSDIIWKDRRVMQDVLLRLRNVESGELELQLQWVNIPRPFGS